MFESSGYIAKQRKTKLETKEDNFNTYSQSDRGSESLRDGNKSPCLATYCKLVNMLHL